MNGPDHYRRAEELLADITNDDGSVGFGDGGEAYVAAAQVHATLALAAATALVANEDPPPSDAHAWWLAAGTKPEKDDDADEELAGEARCRVCGCTENAPCPGGCHWVPDPQMGDLCSRCGPDTAPHWLAEILAQCDAGEITPSDGIAEIQRHMAAAQQQKHDPAAYPAPGSEIPGQPGYVVGTCGHRVAGSEWRSGFRTCERCPYPKQDDGEVSES